MEEDEREDRQPNDKDQNECKGVLVVRNGKTDVHSVEGSNHRGDAQDDR